MFRNATEVSISQLTSFASESSLTLQSPRMLGLIAKDELAEWDDLPTELTVKVRIP